MLARLSQSGFLPNNDPFCMLCGLILIGKPSTLPWTHQFRAVYCTLDGVQLTGASTRNNINFRIPDDDEAEQWGIRETSKHGKTDIYLFHELCWRRLVEHFGPGKLHLGCLFEAVEHLPLPEEHLSYYGYKGNSIPYDPFVPPGLEELMRFAKDPPKRHYSIVNRLADPYPNPTDCFDRLPLEIREAIGALLFTRDVLNLRCASRAMEPLFTSSAFWRSRFGIDGERGFLRTIIQSTKGDVNWRLLYHCTCKLPHSSWLEFEIRIWGILRWLHGETSARFGKEGLRLLDFRGEALQHYHNTSWRNTHAERVDITPSLNAIAISVFQDTRDVFITGMKFIFDDQPSLMLGYSTPGAKSATREIYETGKNGGIPRCDYRYPGIQVTIKVTSLRGFDIVRGPNGVHRINIIQDPDNSYYVGVAPHGAHESTFCLHDVRKAVGVFDDRKMVDLGILGVAKRWQRQYSKKQWEGYVNYYKNKGYIPAHLELK